MTLIDGTFLVIFTMAVINIREQINGYVDTNSSYWLSFSVIIMCTLELVGISGFLFTKRNAELKQERNT